MSFLQESLRMSGVTIRILGPEDGSVLQNVAPDVFDGPVDPRWSAEFLADPRHHLAVALDATGTVVGFASGVHYVHPDKPPQLFVNEVGVAPPHRGTGIGTRVMRALLAHARSIGCLEAWVLTSPLNTGARRFYASVGGVEDVEAPILFSFRLVPNA
jgi:ribosomal protein S18 acetylase RimI-like enzyme